MMSYFERLWRWLHKLCETKIKQHYMARTGWDLRCPHCKTWFSIGGSNLESWNDRQQRYSCNHCGKLSAWEFHGPVAVSVPTVYWSAPCP